MKPKKKRESVAKNPDRNDKRVHVALPIRITYWDEDNKPGLEMACTYDISASGARISKLRAVNKEGEIVAVERGRNKAYCRVVWVGDDNSKLHGQIGLQCVEPDRNIWDQELRDMDEVYEKVDPKALPVKSYVPGNRRRGERVAVEGRAEISNSDSIALNNVKPICVLISGIGPTTAVLSPRRVRPTNWPSTVTGSPSSQKAAMRPAASRASMTS